MVCLAPPQNARTGTKEENRSGSEGGGGSWEKPPGGGRNKLIGMMDDPGLTIGKNREREKA